MQLFEFARGFDNQVVNANCIFKRDQLLALAAAKFPPLPSPDYLQVV